MKHQKNESKASGKVTFHQKTPRTGSERISVTACSSWSPTMTKPSWTSFCKLLLIEQPKPPCLAAEQPFKPELDKTHLLSTEIRQGHFECFFLLQQVKYL
ncbi:unnamed protein product, partial [Mesorhabditis belari]|uniref:Uncharacterized protein n=1 Tax=Mesorhabditis belari TaxID=2138241 RepID=A0AAF3ED43_9BILA